MKKLFFLTLLIFGSVQSANEVKEKTFYKKMGLKKEDIKTLRKCKVVKEALSDIVSGYDDWFFDIDHTQMRKFFLENQEKLSVSEKEVIKKTFPLIIPEIEKNCMLNKNAKNFVLGGSALVGCYLTLGCYFDNDATKKSAVIYGFLLLVIFNGTQFLHLDRQERIFKGAKEYLKEVLAYCTKN